MVRHAVCSAKRVLWLLPLVIGIGAPGFSQKVVIDYASGEILCPEYLGGSRAVAVRIDNLNDILYSYEVKVESSRLRNQGADDFSHLPSQFTPDTTKGAAHKSRPPSCSTKLTTALAKFNAIKAEFDKYTDLNPAKVGNKYVSIKLGRTITAWEKFFGAGSTQLLPVCDPLSTISNQTARLSPTMISPTGVNCRSSSPSCSTGRRLSPGHTRWTALRP